MTPAEREALLLVAEWLARTEGWVAEQAGKTSPLAEWLKLLIHQIEAEAWTDAQRMTEDEERDLRISVMTADLASKQADTALKAKQAFWETPKALVIIAAVAGIAGVLGFQLGRREQPQPTQIVQLPPGTTFTVLGK